MSGHDRISSPSIPSSLIARLKGLSLGVLIVIRWAEIIERLAHLIPRPWEPAKVSTACCRSLAAWLSFLVLLGSGALREPCSPHSMMQLVMGSPSSSRPSVTIRGKRHLEPVALLELPDHQPRVRDLAVVLALAEQREMKSVEPSFALDPRAPFAPSFP